jgi:nitroreductase
VDAYLAIASKRDERRYAERPLPDEVVSRILDAGRLAGSARNLQPWRFLVVEDAGLRERLADEVYAADNVRGAALLVAIVATGGRRPGFDHGRAAQNMMLAAWNEGAASCPNGLPDPERTARLLGLGEDETPVTVLSFGNPARPREPASRPAEEWSTRANRRPLEEVVARV